MNDENHSKYVRFDHAGAGQEFGILSAPPSTPEAIRAAAEEIAERWANDDLPDEARLHSFKHLQLKVLVEHILSRFFGKEKTGSDTWATVKQTCGFCGRDTAHICTAFLKDAAAPASPPPTEGILEGRARAYAEAEAERLARWKERDAGAAPVAQAAANEQCAWTLDGSNDGEVWETGCGQAFQFTDGGPTDNGFIFCYKCGKRIDAGKYSDFDLTGDYPASVTETVEVAHIIPVGGEYSVAIGTQKAGIGIKIFRDERDAIALRDAINKHAAAALSGDSK